MRSRVNVVLSRLLLAVLVLGIAIIFAVLSQKADTSIAADATGMPRCPALERTLKRGGSGDDVKRLQQFLAQDPGTYPEASVTGTFGPVTESAVKRWQIKFNIIPPSLPAQAGGTASTDFGVVGPKTIAAMKEQCSAIPGIAGSAAPNVGGFMSVSPIAGPAPLNVSIQAIVNTANVCGGAMYNLDYGDGSIQSQIYVPAHICRQITELLAHTYRNPGNYMITLSVGQHRAFASVSVYAAGASGQSARQPLTPIAGDSITATPNAGPKPLSVIFTGIINSQQSCGGGKYAIVFGDGTSSDLTFDSSTCSARTFSLAHEYPKAGKFAPELRSGSSAGPIVGSVGVTAY